MSEKWTGISQSNKPEQSWLGNRTAWIKTWFVLKTTLWLEYRLWVSWHPTPVFWPGKSHGRRSLEGWSPWGRWGSDTTERLHFDFSLSCIGEGNGDPLQCSCLENPRDGGAWWAAVYGVAQSRTWLKWLSSSSSRDRWGYRNKVRLVGGVLIL